MVILMIDDPGRGTQPQCVCVTVLLSPGTTPPQPLPRREQAERKVPPSRSSSKNALLLLSPAPLPPSAPFLCPPLSRSEAITSDKHSGLYQQDAPGINEKA